MTEACEPKGKPFLIGIEDDLVSILERLNGLRSRNGETLDRFFGQSMLSEKSPEDSPNAPSLSGRIKDKLVSIRDTLSVLEDQSGRFTDIV